MGATVSLNCMTHATRVYVHWNDKCDNRESEDQNHEPFGEAPYGVDLLLFPLVPHIIHTGRVRGLIRMCLHRLCRRARIAPVESKIVIV